MFRLTATLLIVLGFFATGCSSMSTLPEKENLKVSREAADKDCHLIGKVEGRVQTKTPNQEAALEDMKQEAANKGANYLQVLEYSSLGTSVTGMAYHCP